MKIELSFGSSIQIVTEGGDTYSVYVYTGELGINISSADNNQHVWIDTEGVQILAGSLRTTFEGEMPPVIEGPARTPWT